METPSPLRLAYLALRDAEDDYAWRLNGEEHEHKREALEEAWRKFEKILIDSTRKA